MLEEFAFVGHDYFGGDIAAKSNYRTVVKAAFDEVNANICCQMVAALLPSMGIRLELNAPPSLIL